MSPEAIFLKYSAEQLEELCGRIEKCVDKLTPEQVWTRGTENENAVGNLMLHLAGNMRQWICTELAASPIIASATRNSTRAAESRSMN